MTDTAFDDEPPTDGAPDPLRPAFEAVTAAPDARGKLEALRRTAKDLAQPIRWGDLDYSDIETRLIDLAESHGLPDALTRGAVELVIANALSTEALPNEHANGNPGEFTAPPQDDWQPPADIPNAGPAAPPPKIEATPWPWRNPGEIPPRQWLYARHLIRGFVSGTVAPGGVGKSSLVLVEAIAMATGKPLLGKRVATPLRVWYWNLEDPQEELDRRIAAICLRYGITADDLGDRLHINSGRDQPCIVARQIGGGPVILVPHVDAIIAEVIARQIDVLLIDPFVSCHEVGENDNGAQDMIVKKAWGRVASLTNCAVGLTHHTKKLGDGEVTAESARGGGALVYGCRDVRVLNRMTDAEGKKANVENHRQYFRLQSDKSNLAPPSDKAEWFKLESIDLGNGGGGPSDQVQVVVAWQWPDALAGVSASDVLAVQKGIAAGQWRESDQSRDWAGYAVAEVLRLDLWRPDPGDKPTPSNERDAAEIAARARIKSLLKTWIESGALRAVDGKDEARKDRKFIEVGEWAT